MPSFDHEAIVALFRRRPTLAAELLHPGGERGEGETPVVEQAEVVDTSVGDIVPTERRADLVLLFSSGPGGPGASGGATKRAVIVEVQLAIDPAKQWSWWWYAVGVHVRHHCDVALVVVTPSASVASWARTPLTLGHPGTSLTPLVIGPGDVPLVVDAVVAAAAPEIAVLSVVVHGHGPAGLEVAKAVVQAARGLDEERAVLYADIAMFSVRADERPSLEDFMANGTYEFKSDFAKRYVAQGMEKGIEKGREEGRAQALLTFLAARALDLTPDQRAKVLACTDRATLDAWITRAASATALDDVFGP